MKAIIAAAGRGTRMGALTDQTPKPMLKVAGTPLLEHIIRLLPDVIDEVIVIVGYKGDQVQAHFGEQYGARKLRYVVQDEPTGTGDALLLCRGAVRPDERFMLLWADDLFNAESLKRALARERSFLVHPTDDPRRFGVVTTDANNRILSLEEKSDAPSSNLAMCGVFVLDGAIFSYEPELLKGERNVSGMLKGYMRDYDVQAVTATAWHPIAFPHDLESAERFLSTSSS